MRPKILCTDCQSEIQWGSKFCTSCGEPVDWPDDAAREESAGVGAAIVCPTCGSENSADAGFCTSCGAKLKTQGVPDSQKKSKQSRPAREQGTGRGQKRKEAAGPMFSWKVIVGFLGVILVLVVVLEYFPSREEKVPQQSSAPAPTQAANLQLANQITELEQRVAANPNDLQTVLTLANTCMDGRFFDKAIANYKKFLAKNPRDVNARVDMGICFFETGNLDEARKEMEQGLKYDPKHLMGTFNLGIVNLRAGKVKEANEWFKKTIALAPESEVGKQAKQILEQHSSPLLQNQ